MGHLPAPELTTNTIDTVDLDPVPTDDASVEWRQANIRFSDPATVEMTAVTVLSPLVDFGGGRWFFVRKAPYWRVRLHADLAGAAHLGEALDKLRIRRLIHDWTWSVYEPETRAFGGTAGMQVAHTLFVSDTAHVLAYLAHRQARPTGPDQREQVSILLAALLHRAAGLDWYEQGDVWERIAHHRATATTPTADDVTATRRLLTVDTARLVENNEALTWLAPWAAAYTATGDRLREHSQRGELTRGIRAVLAHHALFAWNRIGLDSQAQAHIAHTAAAAVFDDGPHSRTGVTS
ncbi:thiopeptide-type bacteriocin biosynthesis domain-containing protein [Promicromonospora umidemergens]|uniref:Thiopeptide-type bacteriocin biosynthesis domain-containing protein n=1 Tax=Promicromonospora umidemergens TaxID=629679 RepID=A0ABP8WE57_9MICO|nr:thiopeptide-type bacteriocin biosynthesis protein [Promicromonospora umidemergens]MCP2286552.1 thiopeptide-type bacteriocin biosynthesis domain-containing protein [Promicromonospora umidemergens]